MSWTLNVPDTPITLLMVSKGTCRSGVPVSGWIHPPAQIGARAVAGRVATWLPADRASAHPSTAARPATASSRTRIRRPVRGLGATLARRAAPAEGGSTESAGQALDADR